MRISISVLRSSSLCARPSSSVSSALSLAAALSLLATCATVSGPRFPWPQQGSATKGGRSDVETVGTYRRTSSQVLVRRIKRPSLASLDYAAYHANFMNADPPPEGMGEEGKAPDTAHPFDGAIVLDTLTGSLGKTPLTAAERGHALSLAPLVERLASQKVAGADRLEDVLAKVRAESWGLAGGPQFVRQTAAEGYLHDPGSGAPAELWVKIEFAPWFRPFSSMPDEDGDDVPEIYGQVAPDALGDPAALVAYVHDVYEGRELSGGEVKSWAHKLASYWYPSYNTDLVTPGEEWPAEDTEAPIKAEVKSARYPSPAVVMRGKPTGKAAYNVFLVPSLSAAGAEAAAGERPSGEKSSAGTLRLPRTKPSPDPAPVAKQVRAELDRHGGSWSAWAKEVAPLHTALERQLAAIPSGAKAFAGSDGFLFFGQSVKAVVGGDFGKQKGAKNPIPSIVQFRKFLAEHDVDLLFVPVPTKVEMFPDKAAGGSAKESARMSRFVGEVVNPYQRKLLLDLADKGVETVDLLPALLAQAKADREKSPGEPLYQLQDTHWSARGLELAARVVAQRVRRYPWYKGIAEQKRVYRTKDASFTRHGDLHSRLPEAEKSRHSPETLVGHQVLDADGKLYEDDPESPIVLLGDSFTGVYQLMDCEHAGISAHLARELGAPIDLVMSYGGGPNVRQKLLRRGAKALGSKRLVIWMMTERDLWDFWEGWEPLGKVAK